MRTKAELKAKVRIEIWRHKLHDHRGFTGENHKLTTTINADWFKHWARFPHNPKVKL